MRKPTSILLLFVYLTPALLQLHVVMDRLQAEFFTPPDYIINRDEPELSCNGFRYLNQRIWESDNPADDDTPVTAIFQNQRSIYVTCVPKVTLSPILNTLAAHFSYQSLLIPTPFPEGVFHPPQNS